MNLEIRNGRVVDPANGVDAPLSLHIAQGRVAAVGDAPAGFVAERVIDAVSGVATELDRVLTELVPPTSTVTLVRAEACTYEEFLRDIHEPVGVELVGVRRGESVWLPVLHRAPLCPLRVGSREFMCDENTKFRCGASTEFLRGASTAGPDRRQDLADTLARL